MKAEIEVKFDKINGQEVTPQLIEKTPRLIKVTNTTVKKLTEQIERYFNDHNIEVSVNHNLEHKLNQDKNDK
jgi:NADH dehydrogenase FAD-containing subunit